MTARTAVLLLNHGAADTLDGVETFLANIFRDRDIIKLPVGGRLQRRLSGFIASKRAAKIQLLYGFMGSGSPLLPYMRAQACQLAGQFDPDDAVGVHIGLRYFTPSITDALADIVAEGAERVVVFPQYPQYSTTTVGSCRFELERAVEEVPGAEALEFVFVPPFGSDPDYVEAMAERVRRAVRAAPVDDPTLVFSAHSIPMTFVDDGDPYPQEIAQQAELIARAAGFDKWEIGYQSRSGPVRWLSPETDELMAELLERGDRHFVVVPLSFVQDHLETLVEIDVQIADAVLAAGGSFTRVRAVNATDAFAEMSARLVRDAIASTTAV